jgi:hypothetical protein
MRRPNGRCHSTGNATPYEIRNKNQTKIPGTRRSADIEFVLTARDLAYVHGDTTMQADLGTFEVLIAPDSASGKPTSFVFAE